MKKRVLEPLLHTSPRHSPVVALAGPRQVGKAMIARTLARAARARWRVFFHTAAGAEIDLIVDRPRGERIALEINLSSAPVPSRGFWSGLADLKRSAAYVVYPGKERYPLGPGVETLPVSRLWDTLRD